MKHYSVNELYSLQEENAARLCDMREEIKHLSSSIEGLIRKVQSLEKTKEKQDELNEAVSNAIGEIADELNMLAESEAES